MMNNPKTAATFRILVAGYLIYLGGHNLLNPGAVGRNMLVVVSSIFFIASGVGYALFAYKVYKNSAEESEDANVPSSEWSEEENVLPSEESGDANDSSSEGTEDANALSSEWPEDDNISFAVETKDECVSSSGQMDSSDDFSEDVDNQDISSGKEDASDFYM